MGSLKNGLLLARTNLSHAVSQWSSTLVLLIAVAGTAAVLFSIQGLLTGVERVSNQAHADRAIVLGASASTESASRLSIDAAARIATAPGLKSSDGTALASPEAVFVVTVPTRKDLAPSEVLFRGVTPNAFRVRPELELVQGRLLKPGLREIMVGRRAAAEFDGFEVGKTAWIRNQEWRVVGIFAGGGNGHESEVWGDADVALTAFRRDAYQSMTVILSSPARLPELAQWVKSSPALAAEVQSEREYYANQTLRSEQLLRAVANIVGSIMLLGSLFTALNTMHAAMLARTREFGILRALGFEPESIVLGTVLESLILSAIGATAGAAIAWLAFSGSTGSMRARTNAQLIVEFNAGTTALLWCAVAACIVGVVGGLVPAIRAVMIPVDRAIRSEGA